MRINAGALDRRITILAQTVTESPMGQRVPGYAPIAATYAQRLEMRTQDAARAGGRDTFAVARYLMRYRCDLTTDHRIDIEGTVYDILAIEQPDRRATLILTVEEALA